MRTVVWRQVLDGIPLFDASFVAHISRSNELVSVSSHFLPDPSDASKLTRAERSVRIASPSIRAVDAVLRAAAGIDEPTSEHWLTPVMAADLASTQHPQKFRGAGLYGDATAELVWLPLTSSEMTLCWRVNLAGEESKRPFEVLIDAETGADWLGHALTQAVTPTYNVYGSGSPTPMSPGHLTPSTAQPAGLLRVPVTTSEVSAVSSDPWISSPVNPPFATVGNNVDARTDRSDKDASYNVIATVLAPEVRATSDGNGIFNPPVDLSQDPANYKEAAVVNAFYWANWMHDKLYDLGFTETAGNFQFSNYGRGGAGNDALIIDVQDKAGSGWGDVSLIDVPPTDGLSPRMNLDVYYGPGWYKPPLPIRDSALDAEIILHEYTHGLVTRYNGKGAGINGSIQPVALGEGWGDFYALTLLAEPSDDPTLNYPFGAYSSRGLLTAGAGGPTVGGSELLLWISPLPLFC